MKLPIIGNYVKILRERLSNSIGLPFQEILSQDMIEKAMKDENIKYRKRLYDPIITLWAFICQVLDDDKSCRKAVSRVLAFLADDQNKLPSADTGAYCKARKRLSQSLVIRLVKQTGQALHHKPTDESSDEHLWCNKRVFLTDGSSLSMSDTMENKQKYSQHSNQHEYIGFPVARIVGIFCLHTGALIDAVIDSFRKQEITLFRLLYPHLKSGDVALGDRAFGSYADICLLFQRGVDSVFRIHASRKVDFRKGKRLGRYDHIVYWSKPKASDLSLEPELYKQLPDRMALREIRFCIQIKGFRTQIVTLVTTLLDHETYTYQDLAQLYGFRWQVEIDLRHLKTTMNMEFIQSKSPQMVEKEFYVHLLAYNLIRTVLWGTGIKHQVSPLRLSFRGTMQYILSFIPMLAMSEDPNTIYAKMLSAIAQEKLPDRPFRIEPRVVKRRPKAFPSMKRPRQELRQQLVA